MYTREYLEDNIEEVWDSMGYKTFMKAKDWYIEHNTWCKVLAFKVGLPSICVCGVFASLSPVTSLRQNKMITELFFKGVDKHTGRQIGKAKDIMALFGVVRDEKWEEEEIYRILGGKKTQHFFLCLNNPQHPDACCLDRWSLRVAGVLKDTVTNKQYGLVKDAYIAVAKRLMIKPLELQCSTWSYIRKVYNGEKYD